MLVVYTIVLYRVEPGKVDPWEVFLYIWVIVSGVAKGATEPLDRVTAFSEPQGGDCEVSEDRSGTTQLYRVIVPLLSRCKRVIGVRMARRAVYPRFQVSIVHSVRELLHCSS